MAGGIVYRKSKRILIISAGALLVLIVLFLLGPRPEVVEQISSLNLAIDPETHLQMSEARFTDIKPGTEKMVIWRNPAKKEKTTIALVYLHGFSASRQETAPLSEKVAVFLDANLYYGRLRGHGRTGKALGGVTVNDWLSDGQEAIEIGKRLGDRVILMGSSTGATLSTWMALQPRWQPHILALVLISPNFGPRDPGSQVLLWPWVHRSCG